MTDGQQWAPLRILLDAMETGGAEVQIANPSEWAGIHAAPDQVLLWDRTVSFRIVGPDRPEHSLSEESRERYAERAQRELLRFGRGGDLLPCPRCGGDRLRADFTGANVCHVGGRAR